MSPLACTEQATVPHELDEQRREESVVIETIYGGYKQLSNLVCRKHVCCPQESQQTHIVGTNSELCKGGAVSVSVVIAFIQ